MFRSIIFLIAANFVSRGFYTVAIIVLAETYSADVFAEIIFTATVLLFLSAIGPLRFELAILDKESADQKLASYFTYALVACVVLYLILLLVDKKTSPILLLMSLYANIGMALMISKGRENFLFSLRFITSIIGIIFLTYNYSAKINPQLVLLIVMMCYLSSSLLSFIYTIEAVSLRQRIVIITKHIRIYYAQIIESVFITFSSMALVLVLKYKLSPIEYTNVSLASQLFVSSAILVGSSLSHKYLNLLNKNISLTDFFISYKKIVQLVFISYVGMILISVILLGYGFHLVALEAVSKYYYFIILSMIYLLVIPFSSIMIFKRKLHLNLLIHLGGSAARIAPLLFLNDERAIISYIIISSAFYFFYGLIIFWEHKRL